MTVAPWLDDGDVRLYHGDCLEVLRGLPDRSVHMCATSPPFYGLRDYGTEGQIGLEETPDQWVNRLVEVFREVRRVLRDDGTLWVEIGDSYTQGGGAPGSEKQASNAGSYTSPPRRPKPGYKPKDLLGQPWRLAFALRADGWYLRSEIIWARPNPMPESVTDRPTKSHSTVFLLAKGQWKSRVVALPDLHGKLVHVGNHVGSQNPHLWAHEFGVRLATAILDGTESEDKLALSALYPKVWQELGSGVDSEAVRDLPVEHRAAVYASALLSTHISAKEFLCELDRLGVALAYGKQFSVGGGLPLYTLPPGVDRYGERAIAIHDSGEIGEVDFTAHTVKCSRPSGCSYFYDADAIREAFSENTHSRGKGNGPKQDTHADSNRTSGRNNRSFGDATRAVLGVLPPQVETLDGSAGESPRGPDGRRVTAVKGAENSEQHRDGERWPNPSGANARSVWTIPTEPTPFAHFATWPRKLVARMIQAGTSERGCCPECGAPWVRNVEKQLVPKQAYDNGQRYANLDERHGGGWKGSGSTSVTTLGWSPSCECVYHTRTVGYDDESVPEPVPCTVLDPFAGSGTTSFVARHHGRHSIGIELNEQYLKIAAGRLAQLSLLTGADA